MCISYVETLLFIIGAVNNVFIAPLRNFPFCQGDSYMCTEYARTYILLLFLSHCIWGVCNSLGSGRAEFAVAATLIPSC